MKHYIIILALCISAIHGYSQVLGIETIVENGPQENRINLVILPDGYTSSQQDDFINDATSLVNELFAESPYLEYASYFNVYAIKVASNESGANHPGTATDVGEPASPIKTVDNYFGSTFDYFNIHRLLVATDTNAITNVLSTHFPNYDQAMILVNDPEYGGSGGEFPTASLHFRANPIAIHELGHSFANLKDEYWAGSFYAEEGINMTQETNPTLVRWKNWVGDNNVDIYQHSCGSCGWYKPHQNCMMEDLNDPFCSVCSEGTIEVIHELVSPIDSYSPEASSILISSSQNFQLNLVPTNTLAINWELNGTAIANNVETLTINDTDLNSGTNTLTVHVEDVSSQLRVDNHSTNHKYTITWTLQAPECSIDVYNDFDTADVTFGDNNQCTAFPFTHFYGPGNGPFPWKATIYYAAYHVLLTEDFYNDYNCDVLLNQGTGTNIWMRPHRIKTPPSGHESVMAYWNKSKHTDTNLSGVYTQVNNLEPNTTYQIEFYDLPVRTHAPGRQTANLYYNTKVSFAGQEWNG
ncbi:M64 family metallopeptidase, partial [Pontimicrobium sp. MEBiC01747]